MLGNPPWERIKLQEEEFFAQRDPQIATAPNKSARQKLINALTEGNPVLAGAFSEAKHHADATNKFIQASRSFVLTATGDINTYALFAELGRNLLSNIGKMGLIVPTGIATDDNTKQFFNDIVSKGELSSLFDFENREGLFPGVHRSYKFCLFSISKSQVKNAKFIFFATRPEHLNDFRRVFTLTFDQVSLLKPNTRTAPIFRTKNDAELTTKIYKRVPVLFNEALHVNHWGIQVRQGLFHLTNDLRDEVIFDKSAIALSDDFIPLYEAKLMWQYDHRFASYNLAGNKVSENPEEISLVDKQNPDKFVTGRYYVKDSILQTKIPETYKPSWFIAYRDVTNATNERTTIATIFPRYGVAYTLRVATAFSVEPKELSCFLANINSIVFDYLARQAIGGMHLSDHIMKQLPVLPPSTYTPADIDFIAPRVLELVYTAHDLRPFAEDMGYHGEPFRWDEVRRAQLRAELDAYYARLYGLTRDELRYILDPKEVHGEDFPAKRSAC